MFTLFLFQNLKTVSEAKIADEARNHLFIQQSVFLDTLFSEVAMGNLLYIVPDSFYFLMYEFT